MFGIGWTAIFRWISQLASWAATLYVARVLTPGDYGLLAMAMLPVGLARLVEDFGLDAVLVQDRSLSQNQLARLGGFAVLLGGALAVLFTLAAPLVAQVFGEPELVGATAALSLLFILDGLQVMPRALLQRELQFRRLAIVYCVQSVGTTASLVVLAAFGARYWALIFNLVIGAACATLLLWSMRPFPLAWPRNMRTLLRPLASGWRMLVARGAWYGYSNLDSTFVGRVLGKDMLGVYSFAMTLARMLIEEITALISKVVPGIFSAAQHDPALLRRYFLLLTEAVAYPAFPIAVGTALTAELVVPVLLGDQWGAVIEPLRVLCIYWVFHVAQIVVAPVVVWTGRFRANMWLSLLAVVVLGIGFYYGLEWGLTGVAWAWVIGYPLTALPAYWIAWRIMRLRSRAYFAALLPACGGCAAMIVTVLVARRFEPDTWPPVARLALESAVGAATYALVLALFFRRRLAFLLAVVRTAWRPGAAAPEMTLSSTAA